MVDCHMHMVLDGVDWRKAIGHHRQGWDVEFIRHTLETYRRKGFTYLRDGGDRWGVGAKARELAPEYGIIYRTPLANLCKKGHYGGFIGLYYENFAEYTGLIRQQAAQGGDFVKIMISGIMDFDRAGVLSEEPLDGETIKELIHIAHEEGFSVMAHANGARCVEAAAKVGVDSVEHGAYLDEDALAAMVENGTVWVPTLSAVGNLRGQGRFREDAVQEILHSALTNVRRFHQLGGLLAPGTDAGAWAVPHGSTTEYTLMEQAIGPGWQEALEKGTQAIQKKF